jgi:hypothetical protein
MASDDALCELCSTRKCTQDGIFDCIQTEVKDKFCRECTITYIELSGKLSSNKILECKCPKCDGPINENNYYKLVEESSSFSNRLPVVTQDLTNLFDKTTKNDINQDKSNKIVAVLEIILSNLKGDNPPIQRGGIRRLDAEQLEQFNNQAVIFWENYQNEIEWQNNPLRRTQQILLKSIKKFFDILIPVLEGAGLVLATVIIIGLFLQSFHEDQVRTIRQSFEDERIIADISIFRKYVEDNINMLEMFRGNDPTSILDPIQIGGVANEIEIDQNKNYIFIIKLPIIYSQKVVKLINDIFETISKTEEIIFEEEENAPKQINITPMVGSLLAKVGGNIKPLSIDYVVNSRGNVTIPLINRSQFGHLNVQLSKYKKTKKIKVKKTRRNKSKKYRKKKIFPRKRYNNR